MSFFDTLVKSVESAGKTLFNASPLGAVTKGLQATSNAVVPTRPGITGPAGEPNTKVTVGEVAKQVPQAFFDTLVKPVISPYEQHLSALGPSPSAADVGKGVLGATGDVVKGVGQLAATLPASVVAQVKGQPSVKVPLIGEIPSVSRLVKEQGLLPAVAQELISAGTLAGGFEKLAKSPIATEVKAGLPALQNEGGYIAGPHASFFDSVSPADKFVGPEGQARIELTDKNSTAKPIADIKPGALLPDVFQHPTLYQAYPELNDVKVNVDPNLRANDRGSFDPNTKTITLNADHPTADSVRDTILHEVQHNIQTTEGFAPGASSDAYTEASRKVNRLQSSVDRIQKDISQKNYGTVKPGEVLDGEQRLAEMRSELADKQTQLEKAQTVKAQTYDEYKKSAGEAESRAVTNRSNLDQATLDKTNPYSEAYTGVPQKDLIVGKSEPGVVSANTKDTIGQLEDLAKQHGTDLPGLAASISDHKSNLLAQELQNMVQEAKAGKVEQGSLSRNENGTVIRQGRTSTNPDWYKELYKDGFNKARIESAIKSLDPAAPKTELQQKLVQIADQRLNGKYTDSAYGKIPANDQYVKADRVLKAIDQVQKAPAEKPAPTPKAQPKAATSETTPETTKRGSLEYVGSGIKEAIQAGNKIDVSEPTATKPSLISRAASFITGKSPAGEDFRPTGAEINKAYDGLRREQQVIGKQVSDAIKEGAPSELDRQALTAIKEVGSRDKLAEYAMNEQLPEEYRKIATRAAEMLDHPTPETDKAMKIMTDFYKQTGQTLKDAEVIKGLKDGYSNRIYEKSTGTTTEPSGELIQGTRHTLAQKYADPFAAALDGFKPNLDAARLAQGYSEDIARVVPNRIIINSLKEAEFGKYVKPGEVPEGWVTLPGTERNIPFIGEDGEAALKSTVFAVPQELASAIKPLASPDYFTKINTLNKLQEVNALSKFGKLGWSLVHWYNEGKELLAQTKGGLQLGGFVDLKNNGDLNKMERFVAKYGVTTETSPDAQINILDKVREDNGVLGKLTSLPGVKQALDLAQKNNEALFEHAIPTMKVVNGFQKMMEWVDKHPNASEAEATKAFQGLAREVNDAHGGINWTALGKDPSSNSLARFSLLAYDWTYSNWDKAKLALTPDLRAAGPNAARASVVASLITGYTAFKVLNQIFNNGQTDPGHEHEVKIGGVYVSTYPASVADALKLFDKTQQRGIIGGPASFIAGKLSPVGQAVVGILSNTNQFGAPITSKGNSQFQNAVSALSFLGGTVAPTPIGGTGTVSAISSGASPAGIALAASGLGRTPSASSGKSKGGKSGGRTVRAKASRGRGAKISVRSRPRKGASIKTRSSRSVKVTTRKVRIHA